MFLSKVFYPSTGAVLTLALGLSAAHASSRASVPAAAKNRELGASASNAKPLTIALKYVTYLNDKNEPVVSESQAKSMVDRFNQLYASCNIQFKTEEYVPVVPKNRNLAYNPSSTDELTQIRKEFDVPSEMVIINTGKWDHSGGLGADGANAWTAMPGQSPLGAIIEAPEATNGPLVAHELGHYLSLDHDSDQQDLMSPVIYPDSTTLTQEQCDQARESAQGVDSAMLR